MYKNIIAVTAVLLLIGWAVFSEVSDRQQAQSVTQTSTVDKAVVGKQKGNLAPNFSLQDLDGNSVSLDDYRGKTLFLNFWASWCPPCKAEMPHMRKIADDYEEKDVVILAVNLTNTERTEQDVIDFVEEFQLQFPIIMDQEGDAADLFDVIVYPTTYVLDPNGIITDKYMGPIHYDTMKNAINKAS